MFKLLRYKSQEIIYNIGFIEHEQENDGLPEICQNDIHWLKHNYQSKGWFADPFILDYDAKEIIVLVEEKNYELNRGIICKLIVDRKTYVLKERVPLLILNTHLSFPNILKHNGKVYVYPENYQSGKSIIYELNRGLNHLEPVDILANMPLTDAVIYQDGEDYYILTTTIDSPNGNVLSVLKSDNLLSGYKLFKEITFPDNSARNGGNILHIDGNIYKVSQDCNGGYGKGLILYEMDRNFRFFKLKEFHLQKPFVGLHTYNRTGILACVDNQQYRYKTLHSIKVFLKKSF